MTTYSIIQQQLTPKILYEAKLTVSHVANLAINKPPS